MRLAVTSAVNCTAVTNVVARTELPICTVAPETKPLPFTVNVNVGPPAMALFGFSDVITGAVAPDTSRGATSIKQRFQTRNRRAMMFVAKISLRRFRPIYKMFGDVVLSFFIPWRVRQGDHFRDAKPYHRF